MSKYNNKKVELDGIKFHSESEAIYYKQLKWAKEGKTLKSFEIQPKFILQEKFKKNGQHHRAITYTADFKVTELDGKVSIIDIKGSPKAVTETFKIKKKLFEHKFPDLTIKVIYHNKKQGFYEI